MWRTDTHRHVMTAKSGYAEHRVGNEAYNSKMLTQTACASAFVSVMRYKWWNLTFFCGESFLPMGGVLRILTQRTFRSPVFLLLRVNVPSGNLHSQEQKFPGTFAPGDQCSPELSFPGANVPGNFFPGIVSSLSDHHLHLHLFRSKIQ